jgi:hypothetical protein
MAREIAVKDLRELRKVVGMLKGPLAWPGLADIKTMTAAVRECPFPTRRALVLAGVSQFAQATTSAAYTPQQKAQLIKMSLVAEGRRNAARPARAPEASEEEQARRLAICQSCENLDGGVCQLCKCVVSKRVKRAARSCPDSPSRH